MSYQPRHSISLILILSDPLLPDMRMKVIVFLFLSLALKLCEHACAAPFPPTSRQPILRSTPGPSGSAPFIHHKKEIEMTAIEWRRLRWPAFEDLWRYPFEKLMSLYPPDLNKGREGKDYMKYFSHHPTVIEQLEPLTEKPEEVDMDALIAVSTLLRKNGEIVDGSWNRKLTRSIVKYLKDRGVPPATISTFTNANIRERKGFASRRGYIKHRASQKGMKPSDEQMIQRNLRRKVEYARWKDFRKSPIVFSKSLTQDDNGERVEPHVVVERVQALGVANKFPSVSAYHKALKALMIQNGFSEAEATGAHGMIIREQHIQTSKNYAHRRRELSKSKGVANGTTHSTVTQSMTKQMGLWADEAEVIKVPYSEDWWKVENI